MISFLKYPAVSLCLMVFFAAMQPALSYEGVLAPAEDESAVTDGGGDDGYSGVIAPTVPKTGAGRPPKGQAEQGYVGVVPGYVAPDVGNSSPVPVKTPPAGRQQPGKNYPGNFTPMQVQPQMSPQYATIDPKIRSAQDLQTLAMIYSFDKNADNVSDSMARNFRLPKEMVSALEQPRVRVNDMLPMESMIKDSIDAALMDVENRRQNPADTIQNLKKMREGLRAKRTIPDAIYKTMGMPATYIKEEREGIDKSLSRIDSAIRKLGG